MVLTLSLVCFLVAAVLFAVAALPAVQPHHSRLIAIGLVFMAAGHIAS